MTKELTTFQHPIGAYGAFNSDRKITLTGNPEKDIPALKALFPEKPILFDLGDPDRDDEGMRTFNVLELNKETGEWGSQTTLWEDSSGFDDVFLITPEEK